MYLIFLKFKSRVCISFSFGEIHYNLFFFFLIQNRGLYSFPVGSAGVPGLLCGLLVWNSHKIIQQVQYHIQIQILREYIYNASKIVSLPSGLHKTLVLTLHLIVRTGSRAASRQSGSKWKVVDALVSPSEDVVVDGVIWLVAEVVQPS